MFPTHRPLQVNKNRSGLRRTIYKITIPVFRRIEIVLIAV